MVDTTFCVLSFFRMTCKMNTLLGVWFPKLGQSIINLRSK
ncbi:hypothetical protein BTN50_0920 [Candidatus Enterovibrio altilux]|uniref:Uncharacterized protein n=1 Tax=Candidatus Enterovibrio altilux TaxID=1927128 RepID=A0A291B8Y1_9GAMM|nr:hypothetical protein BTN50_0920 [Candidatus Enterovibrio luxaltus]